MQGGLRQRSRKTVLPINSAALDNSNHHRQRKWRKGRRRRNVWTQKGRSLTIIVVIALVVGFSMRHRFHNNKKMQSSKQNGKTRIRYDFQCLNFPHKRGVLNDDYCDCPDGSDEPLTSACSHLLVGQKTFACKNNHDMKLFPSRVQDTVLDCTDGSDEQ